MMNRFNLKGMFAGLLTGFCAMSITLGAQAQETSMLIRTVPIEVSSYSEAAELDQNVADADKTYQLLTTTSPLLVHMEALRRAYHVFGTNDTEREKLLAALKDRYMQDASNAEKFFDYGYAQLVMEGNKNGLFFLRKANDKLVSPFTSLAYGLAQVDIDYLVEHSAPEELSTRKMDVGYKLKDALIYNREDALPGVWPTYVNIIGALKSYPAFESLVNEDVTTIYVPYGSTSLASGGSSDALLALALASSETGASEAAESPLGTLDTSCPAMPAVTDWGALAFSKPVDLGGKSLSVSFFTAKAGGPYQVRVMGQDNQVVGHFTSYKAPHIVEDLDGDGKFELVVRQYEKDPYHPLYVYRWNGSCYVQDKRVASYFQ